MMQRTMATLVPAFVSLLAGTVGVTAQSLSFAEIYTVGTDSVPAEQAFDPVSAMALGADGTLYVGSTRPARLASFDSQGRFLTWIGREGTGPGEFEVVSSIALSADGDSVFVHDRFRGRISLFTRRGQHLRTINVQLRSEAPIKMYRHSSGMFLFVGAAGETNDLVHVVDERGAHVRSVGALLPPVPSALWTPIIREQLVQGEVVEVAGGDIIVALRAPYRIARFDLLGRRKWETSDTLLPWPWARHIKVTPTSYSIAFYPSINGAHALDEDLVYILAVDFEGEQRYADVRRASDGSLIRRQRSGFESYVRALRPASVGGGIAAVHVIDPFSRFIVSRWTMR